MVKFTFTKGEGEDMFVAAGAQHQYGFYREYEITGTWDPQSEDGKTPVELKITYGALPWFNAKLKGVFDPEENSLRGTALLAFSELPGEFVFKRDPDLVRFYPAPSAITARGRWKFATTLVLDRIRREAWSSQRIFQRIRDRKLFMKWVLRSGGGAPADGEQEEVDNLALRLYEADVQFCTSLRKFDLNKNMAVTFA